MTGYTPRNDDPPTGYQVGYWEGFDHGHKATEWIPVDEALPPEGQRVLTFDSMTNTIQVGRIYRYKSGIDRPYIWSSGKPTHWQYLPENPKTHVEPPIAWDEATQKKLQKNAE